MQEIDLSWLSDAWIGLYELSEKESDSYSEAESYAHSQTLLAQLWAKSEKERENAASHTQTHSMKENEMVPVLVCELDAPVHLCQPRLQSAIANGTMLS